MTEHAHEQNFKRLITAIQSRKSNFLTNTTPDQKETANRIAGDVPLSHCTSSNWLESIVSEGELKSPVELGLSDSDGNSAEEKLGTSDCVFLFAGPKLPLKEHLLAVFLLKRAAQRLRDKVVNWRKAGVYVRTYNDEDGDFSQMQSECIAFLSKQLGV